MKKISTKAVAETAILLALAVISQFLKNTSVFITGPIINAIIIIATDLVGLWAGTMISILTPVTSFLITQSPIIAAIPLIMPVIMIGNFVMAFSTFMYKKSKNSAIIYAICLMGCLVKAGFMWVMTSFVLLPLFGSNLKEAVIKTAKVTFSSTQLITAVIGVVLAEVILRVLRKALKSSEI